MGSGLFGRAVRPDAHATEAQTGATDVGSSSWPAIECERSIRDADQHRSLRECQLATLLEVFTINPFPLGWDFVAEALRWLAEDAGADIPGVRALDPAGLTVRDLQSSPAPARYSALVSNYHPDPNLWQRAQDIG